jgi:hypothetical protein
MKACRGNGDMVHRKWCLVVSLTHSTKDINHQQMYKGFFSSIVTHSYMCRPCWVIFRENFLLSFQGELSVSGQAETTESSHLQKQRNTQSTAQL